MLILKFFSKKEYLEDFLDGKIYCKHPLFYRRIKTAGVGDRFESCQDFAEGLEQLKERKIIINGRTLTYENGLRSITIHPRGQDDYYLHCWFSATPSLLHNEGLILFNNLNRVASEFGDQYIAVVPPENVFEFFKRMYTSECEKIGFVKYSNNRQDWGIFCKSISYQYQREFRFLYQPDNTSDVNIEDLSFIANAPKGFRDIIKVININEINLHLNSQQKQFLTT